MNSFLKQIRGLVVVGAALIGVSQMASAQGLGAISGTVVDSTGASVPSANVTLTAVKTGQTVITQSHADGLYVFPSLPPADYRLDITAQGFKKFEQRNLVIGTQQEVSLNVRLEIGKVTESIQVTEQVPLLASP